MARLIYATNSPFTTAEHPEFIKLVTMLCSSYHPPSRHDISGHLLDSIHSGVLDECKEELSGKPVSVALDGWSNIHNEPVACMTATTNESDNYLVHIAWNLI